MRSLRSAGRPSARAVAVAAALAGVIVLAGTTGAVAGKLITGKDIKDRSITGADLAKGSVNWKKQLDPATRKRIAALAGAAGTTGPGGPTGAMGPSGAPGAPGPSGAPGSPGSEDGGSLVAWDYYGASGYTDDTPIPGLTQLRGLNEDEIQLPGAGVYLVTVRGVFIDPPYDGDEGPVLRVRPWGTDGGNGDGYPGDCAIDLGSYMFSGGSGDVLPCQATFSVFADEAEILPVALPGTYGDECSREDADGDGSGCDAIPGFFSVSVYAMGGAAPDPSTIPGFPDLGCGCPTGEPTDGPTDDPSVAPRSRSSDLRELLEGLRSRS